MSNDATDGLTVEQVSWDSHRTQLRTIREPVFIREQGVPADLEWDDLEDGAWHFLATRDGEPVACGRMTRDGKVGRMAVLAECRGLGYGRAILAAIVDHARSRAMPRLLLHAQQHASEFYTRGGFRAFGEPFEEAGIAHIAMALQLDYRGYNQFISGVDYPRPFDQLVVELCNTAARTLCILSPSLDHAVFDNPDLARALSALARQSRQTEVKILIRDSRALVARGHRVLALARRIPSSLHIQILAEHPAWNDETIIIRDRDGVLYKPGESDHEGFFEPNSRASTQRHLELFQDLWRYSVQDVDLRSLSI
jgi:predicted GNAT family N-acyltransferase